MTKELRENKVFLVTEGIFADYLRQTLSALEEMVSPRMLVMS